MKHKEYTLIFISFDKKSIVKNFLILIVLIFLMAVPGRTLSFPLSDRAEISVLTCGPSELIHAIYGHTAIRVKDERRLFDVVFNYGVFSFNRPDFIYQFAKGRTDYMLAPERFDDFLKDYKRNGRSVYEQVLNLTADEKQRLFDFLIENAKPENREYRYNFFYDNCATRVRDVVEKVVEGQLVFRLDSGQNRTFRQHVTEYQKVLPWTDFGIQLTLGTPADKVANAYEEMFLPDFLMKHFASAQIKNGDESRPLVKKTSTIYDAKKEVNTGLRWWSPLVILLITLAVIIYYSFKQMKVKEINYWVDYCLLFFTGLIGLVALWLVTYSEHPAMHPNYNLWWAVPANIPFMIIWLVKGWRPVSRWYWTGLAVWLILFFAFNLLIPQSFHVGVYLIALMLLSRSLLHTFRLFKEKKQQYLF